MDKDKTIEDALIQERAALIEMYKAGFLDAYKLHKKLETKEDWALMNKFYKDSFIARFEKKVKKALKKLD